MSNHTQCQNKPRSMFLRSATGLFVYHYMSDIIDTHVNSVPSGSAVVCLYGYHLSIDLATDSATSGSGSSAGTLRSMSGVGTSCVSSSSSFLSSSFMGTPPFTYTNRCLHNVHYTECPSYQGLTADCSIRQFHKVHLAHLGHFTSALGSRISQSIPLSPQTAQGALKNKLVFHHR